MRSEFDLGGAHARAEAKNLFFQAIRDCELEASPQNPERETEHQKAF